MLANNEMSLLSSFFNSFKNLFGMLPETNAFLAFSELIIEVISSSSVGLNVKVSSTDCERLFEKCKFGLINLVLICLAIVVKWLLNSLAMIAGSVMLLPFIQMKLI